MAATSLAIHLMRLSVDKWKCENESYLDDVVGLRDGEGKRSERNFTSCNKNFWLRFYRNLNIHYEKFICVGASAFVPPSWVALSTPHCHRRILSHWRLSANGFKRNHEHKCDARRGKWKANMKLYHWNTFVSLLKALRFSVCFLLPTLKSKSFSFRFASHSYGITKQQRHMAQWVFFDICFRLFPFGKHFSCSGISIFGIFFAGKMLRETFGSPC